MDTPTTTQTELLLLGLLMQRPMHGYELYQQIQTEGMGTWFSISPASVYYALDRLHERDLVTEIRQHRRSARKATYRLTEGGRSAFFAGMELHLATQEETFLASDLAMYLLNKMPVQRAIPQLQQRQKSLARQVREVDATLAAAQDSGCSPLKLAILDHRRRFLEMEHEWLTGILHEVQANEQDRKALAGEGCRLMVLDGDLRHYHLPDLIRMLVSGQHTGTLTLADGSVTHSVRFEGGQPVCMACWHQGETPKPPPSVDLALEGLCDQFYHRMGHFTFEQGPACGEGGIPLEVSAEDLILRGCRRVDDWGIIQQLVPSAETIFEVGLASQNLERGSFTEIEQQVAAAVDGTRDVATIARELALTLFETSRVCYCLAEIGVISAADPDKIRLRRAFREIAELLCKSTLAWRSSPEDRTCEEQVNKLCKQLPIRLDHGRIEDRSDPRLGTEELGKMYGFFLKSQLHVISQRFGHSNAKESFDRTLRQLAPELQDVAKCYGLDRFATS
jgi:DNA-binding PadR family transcriptional regulator